MLPTYLSQKTGKAANLVQLGSSDLKVSECCLGTMTWGEQNTEEEAHEQLNYAFDQGINWLDTAEMYPVMPREPTQGRTEKYIGTWLKQRSRESVIVATKVAGHSEHSKYIRNGETVRVTKDQVKYAIENSLERLQTDYVDLLQIHWPDRYVPLFGGQSYTFGNEREFEPFEEQLRAFEEVIKEGKVRYIGVSNETSFGVMSFIRAAEQYNLPRIVSIQNCYHLNSRVQYESDLVETCRFMDVGLMAYSPLAGGTLSGKYLDPDFNDPKARFIQFPGYMARYTKSQSYQATLEYADVAKKHGLSLTQMAIAFVKGREFVSSTIIGATSIPTLKEDIEAFDVDLSPECLQDIEDVFKRHKDPARN